MESLWRESIERYALPNGLTVLLKHDSASPVSSVQVWVKTGSIHEGAFLGAGLSHYLEHMLFLGSKSYPGPEEYQVLWDVTPLECVPQERGPLGPRADRRRPRQLFHA